MSDLVDIRLLLSVCLNQLHLVQSLAPDVHSSWLFHRAAAAISCILPRLPDSILEMAINEAAKQLNHSLA
jgi:hypothetical protein